VEILNYARSLDHLRRHRGCLAVAFSTVMVLGNCLIAGSPDQPLDEYQVKAAFLYNFVKFIQWPAQTFPGSSEPIVICVLGQDPFGRSLDDTVAGRAIDGRSLTIHRLSTVKQTAGCHVLFISAAENKYLPSTFAEVKTRGLLTIGDSCASGTDGVIINFKMGDGKVYFEINVNEAERAKLRISSRLLSLAHIVDSQRK
jgi:hypothetical protein